MPPAIKICGICNMDDAQLAIDHGAKYLGFIFATSSPRYIEPEIASSIINSLRNQVKVVGIFQNASVSEIENIASAVNLDYFQLHGNESPAMCSRLSKPVIKAFQITDRPMHEQPCTTLSFANTESAKDVHPLFILEKYRQHCAHFLFDKPKKYSFPNWLDYAINQLESIENELGNYFFAGTLNSSNINTVLQTLHPAVIDVASSVEETPRQKSKALIADFCNRTLSTTPEAT